MELYCTRPSCSRPRNIFPDLDDKNTLANTPQKFCTTCGMPLILGGRYLSIRLLGQGGFGAAFLARDRHTPALRQCVAKQFLPSVNLNPAQLQVAQNLFEREAAVLEELGQHHDQIPNLFASFSLSVPISVPNSGGKPDEFFYLVQEFIDGEDLEQELEAQGIFPEEKIREILESILPVLEFVHQQGVIHRDIKPSNIMRDRWGKLYLLDFGSVKQVTAGTTPQGKSTRISSPGFAPPEQMVGDQVFPATDIYAFAVTLLTLLTGKEPQELLDSYTSQWQWRKYAQVSDRLATVLDKMLRSIPSERYVSAAAVLKALKSTSTITQKPTQNPVRVIPVPIVPPSSPPVPTQLSTKQPSPNQCLLLPRRKFLTLLGLAAVGSGSTLVLANFKSPSSQAPKSIATPTPPVSTSPLITPTLTPSLLITPKIPSTSKAFTFETVKVDGNRTIIERKNNQVVSLIYDFGKGVTLDLVNIPAGEFTMGMPPGERQIALDNLLKYGVKQEDAEKSLDSSTLLHKVTLKQFWMGQYTVTNALWKAVMGTEPSKHYDVRFQGDNQPVVGVSWDNCNNFCKKLSALTGKEFRLPSEAEWEYACRANTTTPFYFGETITPALVNYSGNYPYGNVSKGEYRGKTVDVDSFSPNAWGLYQMHGNVWQWCSDRWHENYNGATTDGSSWETGTVDNSRVQRGGS